VFNDWELPDPQNSHLAPHAADRALISNLQLNSAPIADVAQCAARELPEGVDEHPLRPDGDAEL
jgi:hypothetical protein